MRRFLSTSRSLYTATRYEAMSYERCAQIRREHLHPSLFMYYNKTPLIHKGEMQWLWGHDSKTYLDMFGGICTVSVGHCHPVVKKAVADQLDQLWHTSNIYMHPKIHEYAEKLVATLPKELDTVYFVNSGSEANDLALLMARCYTGRWDVISLRNAYHGAVTSTMGLTAHATWRPNTPTGFGVINARCPDPYRGAWGGDKCRDSAVQTNRHCDCPDNRRSCVACDAYVEEVADVLRYSCQKQGAAAFFAESIQGVGGTVQFPRDYLRRVYDMIRAQGGLCIADEVQTGFGRIGTHFWGFESHSVTPDIVTMAKGIGNGFPLAAVVTTSEIAKSMSHAIHFNTYGGNPLSCAAGIAVLDVIKADKCQENSKAVGDFYMERLRKLRDKHAIVGDVRGKGLMLGVELVTDKESRTPLPAADMAKIMEDTMEGGVLFGKGGFYGNVLRIKPPMCITKENAQFAVDLLDDTLSRLK